MAGKESGTTFSVMNNLFANGNFGHILLKIFLQLDGNSLNSALEVSRAWRRFVASQIFAKDAVKAGLQLSWSQNLPSYGSHIHGAKCSSMRCDASHIVVGEEATGKVHVYARNDIAAKAKTQLVDLQQMAPGIHGAPSNSVVGQGGLIEPDVSINAHVQTITAIAMNKDILLTGSLDGKLKVWRLKDGFQLGTLMDGDKHIYDIRLDDRAKTVYFGFGFTVMVYTFAYSRVSFRSEIVSMFMGHKEVVFSLALSARDPILASGSGDKTIIIWDTRRKKTQNTLHGHTGKVRCVSLNSTHLASGSFDRTCRLWELKTGNCVRILRQELMVRVVALDDMGRLVTGDSGGYVYVWSLENCLDSSKGSDSLCLRAHNAIDSDRPMRETHKMIFGIHLEHCVLITLAGQNGRIGLQDFWQHGGADIFRLETFAE